MAIFSSAELSVTREQVSAWLKKEEDPAFVLCTDTALATFLNGLINDKRGKKEGVQPAPEKRLTNNIILTKLKIAFNLRAEDIIELLAKLDLRISKPELSAFSRKPDHKHYRECKDQFLRNFLKGLDNLYHVERTSKPASKKAPAVDHKQNNKNNDEEIKTTYSGAKPQASKMYVNPNKSKTEQPAPSRKVLKLKPEDIWGKQ